MKALITGGTSGIGLAMAKELLKKNYEVILISRKEGDLDELKKEYPSERISFFSYHFLVIWSF